MFEIKKSKYKENKVPVKLVLGNTYSVSINKHKSEGVFIKVTPKGYNILCDQTLECILKPAIYMDKKHENTFWLPWWIIIKEVKSRQKMRTFCEWALSDPKNKVQ